MISCIIVFTQNIVFQHPVHPWCDTLIVDSHHSFGLLAATSMTSQNDVKVFCMHAIINDQLYALRTLLPSTLGTSMIWYLMWTLTIAWSTCGHVNNVTKNVKVFWGFLHFLHAFFYIRMLNHPKAQDRPPVPSGPKSGESLQFRSALQIYYDYSRTTLIKAI